jgi:hypothetical protein
MGGVALLGPFKVAGLIKVSRIQVDRDRKILIVPPQHLISGDGMNVLILCRRRRI